MLLWEKKTGRFFFYYSQEALILSGLIIISQFIFIKAKKSLHLSKLSPLSRTKLSPLKIEGHNILPKIFHFENLSILKKGANFRKVRFKRGWLSKTVISRWVTLKIFLKWSIFRSDPFPKWPILEEILFLKCPL